MLTIQFALEKRPDIYSDLGSGICGDSRDLDSVSLLGPPRTNAFRKRISS